MAESLGQPRKQSLTDRFSNLLRSKKSRSIVEYDESIDSSTLFKTRTKSATSKEDLPTAPIKTLKKKKSSGKLQKKPPPEVAAAQAQNEFHQLPPNVLQYHRKAFRDGNIDTQLGERRDDTAMLHALAHKGSFDSFKEKTDVIPDLREPGESLMAKLSTDVWDSVIDYLNPVDAANLAFASRTLLRQIGYKPWRRLDRPENKKYRVAFLLPMDRHLPYHLFCFPCARYHLRIQAGNERLRLPDVVNPIIDCPNIRLPSHKPPRLRMTPKRQLPFTFVQLVLRAHEYGPEYGVTTDSLSRRWQEGEWTHLSRYHVHDGHLLMRMTSYAFAEPGLPLSGQRMLLYDRDDYSPYFSACAHWRDGDIMKICKCALGHIPLPKVVGFDTPAAVAARLQDTMNNTRYNPNAIVTLCGTCQPMRRCPCCPTEFLVEIRLMEDKSDKTFKRAIVVTRWSDLGSASMSDEWRSMRGEDGVAFDSFAMAGKRAIAGIFESYYTDDHIPGARILSLNPKNRVRGEDDDDVWY